jgi:hypothetical protein
MSSGTLLICSLPARNNDSETMVECGAAMAYDKHGNVNPLPQG